MFNTSDGIGPPPPSERQNYEAGAAPPPAKTTTDFEKSSLPACHTDAFLWGGLIRSIKNIKNSFSCKMHDFAVWMDRYRLINDRLDKEPYLERYYLFLKDRTWFPFNIFLHKFLKSDPDDLHDHPWPYCTIILKGGYWEHVPIECAAGGADDKSVDPAERHFTTERKWWGPGSVRFASAGQLHRIELDQEKLAAGDYTWTLFIPGRRFREWGFKTKDGWIANEQYLENKKKNN